MKAIFLLIAALFATACSHTISFRANHFAVPVTADKQWGGHAAVVVPGSTKITLINDISSNPPNRSEVKINEDINLADIFMIGDISLDASLGIYDGLDLFMDGSILGFRYQFLNPGPTKDVWVGAMHGAYAQRTYTSSQSSGAASNSASTDILTTQAGISLGYKYEKVVPYFSYVLEAHETKTTVKNTHGTFGPYKNIGSHHYYSVGIASSSEGISYAIEYSIIDIFWDRAPEKGYQNSVGAKLGVAW